MSHSTQPELRFLNHRENAWQIFTPTVDMALAPTASERPLGSVYLGASTRESRTSFVVWAPSWRHSGVGVEAVTPGGERLSFALEPDVSDEDYFFGEGPVPAGSTYQYVTVEGRPIGPDPASLAYDKHRGRSVVLDRSFVEQVRARLAAAAANLPSPEVLTLMAQVHLGTSGGLAGLEEICRYYRDLGYHAVQTLPETLFPGRFNAGYDVSSLFAVDPTYGTPTELAQCNASAAELGLLRIADRVHNHVHPANLIERYGPYFDGPDNEWGRGPTSDGIHANAVRRYHREADRRWLEDFAFTGLRYDATFRVDDELNRLLAADAADVGRGRGVPVFTIAEDNHNDRRVTRSRRQDSDGFGFCCQYAPDKRSSALTVALLAQEQPITKHYLKPFAGLGEHEDAAAIYGSSERWQQAFARSFRLHAKALRQGMALDHRRGERQIEIEPPHGEPPWATLALVEYHDGPQNNEAGQFVAAEMGPARTATHYLAHAVGPESKLIFRGAEEVVCSGARRFGWLADMDAIDKLNAAMGRHLDDLAGDRTIKPPWHPEFRRLGDDGRPLYVLDAAAGEGVVLRWDNWRIGWVIGRAKEAAQRRGTAEVLRPDLLRAGEPVPQVDWGKYFAQVAETGRELVDFSSETALQAYGFDPQQAVPAARVAREYLAQTFAAVARHVPGRDWHCLCVVAWDVLGTALLQRWDLQSGRRVLFIENLSLEPVEIELAASAARVGGQQGRVETLDSTVSEHEHDYDANWELWRTSGDSQWGAASSKRSDATTAPEQLDLRHLRQGEGFTLRAGHSVVFLGA